MTFYIEAYESLNPPCSKALSQFNYYASTGQLNEIQQMVQHGFSVHDFGAVALTIGARKGDLPLVQYLIEQNVRPELQQLAFLSSAIHGHLPLVQYFITQTSINPRLRQDEALTMSIMNRRFHIARHLVEQGAPIVVGLEALQQFPINTSDRDELLQWLLDYQQCQQEQALLNEVPMSPNPSPIKGRL